LNHDPRGGPCHDLAVMPQLMTDPS
jgi:hypothetical protein